MYTGGVESKRLGDDPFGHVEVVEVVDGRRSAEGVDLRVKAAANVRMGRQGVEGEGDGGRGGVVPREDHRHDLIAEAVVAQRLAPDAGLAETDEQREEVVGVGRVGRRVVARGVEQLGGDGL